MQQQPDLLIQILPMLLMSMLTAPAAYLLAKDKGRNVLLWTILGVIPIINFCCIWYFSGASNLRLERKLDEIGRRLGGTS